MEILVISWWMEHRMLEELCRAAVRTGSGFRRKVGRQLIGSSRTNTPGEKASGERSYRNVFR